MTHLIDRPARMTPAEIDAESERIKAITARIKAYYTLCSHEHHLQDEMRALANERGRVLALMDAALSELEIDLGDRAPQWADCLYGPRPSGRTCG